MIGGAARNLITSAHLITAPNIGTALFERKYQTDKQNMKVINGNRRELEKEIIHILMSDTNNEAIDSKIDRLKPISRLNLVTISTNSINEGSLPSPQPLHQNKQLIFQVLSA